MTLIRRFDKRAGIITSHVLSRLNIKFSYYCLLNRLKNDK